MLFSSRFRGLLLWFLRSHFLIFLDLFASTVCRCQEIAHDGAPHAILLLILCILMLLTHSLAAICLLL